MMRKIKVDPFENVGANAKATAQLRMDGAGSLFGIVLVLGGTTFTDAHISAVKCKVGGKDLVPGITGTRLEQLAVYDGATADATYLPIFFGDPWARTLAGMHLGSIDSSVYGERMSIEVDIGAATAPTLEAYAMLTPPKLALGLGYGAQEAEAVRAYMETIIQPGAAVTAAYPINIGSAAGGRIRKMAFFHTNMTHATIKRDGIDLLDDVSGALAAYMQADVFARNPQAGLYVVDPMEDASASEMWPTLDNNGRPFSYSVRVTTSGSDTITAYTDLILPLRNL